MNLRSIDSKQANRRTRVHTTGKNRHAPGATHQSPSTGRQGSGQWESADTRDVHSQTMRRLRMCIGLLTAFMLAAVAHAVTDGLTPGLVLGLALTTLLLLASLGLWRVGSRREPDDTEPPGIEH